MKIVCVTAGAGGMFCGSCLHDNTLAAAVVDRLVHHAEIVVIEGDSYRMKRD